MREASFKFFILFEIAHGLVLIALIVSRTLKLRINKNANLEDLERSSIVRDKSYP